MFEELVCSENNKSTKQNLYKIATRKRAIDQKHRSAKDGSIECLLGMDTLCRSVCAEEKVKLSWADSKHGEMPLSCVNVVPHLVPSTFWDRVSHKQAIAWPASRQGSAFLGLPSGHCYKYGSLRAAFCVVSGDPTQVLTFAKGVLYWLSLALSASSEATPGRISRQVLFKTSSSGIFVSLKLCVLEGVMLLLGPHSFPDSKSGIHQVVPPVAMMFLQAMFKC